MHFCCHRRVPLSHQEYEYRALLCTHSTILFALREVYSCAVFTFEIIYSSNLKCLVYTNDCEQTLRFLNRALSFAHAITTSKTHNFYVEIFI
jgi:hypothetical protein